MATFLARVCNVPLFRSAWWCFLACLCCSCPLRVYGTGQPDGGGADDCSDGERNGLETDVDCGGGLCPRCNAGQRCMRANDCLNESCEEGTCQHCGNGIVEGNEDCDDEGESATCDRDCTPARCGDDTVNVAADEECDDGNDIDNDGCSNSCKLPTCDDDFQNGGETATDCGGPCGATCEPGQSCQDNDDCVTLACLDESCHYPPSCLAILGAHRGADSGSYFVDPDGLADEVEPFEVYCEMDLAGGGWQLVSVVRNDSDQLIVGDSFCTDLDVETACKGQIHSAQVSAHGQVLISEATGAHWMMYAHFSGTAESALRYFSRELTVVQDSWCSQGDNVCGDTARDPELAVAATSGHAVDFNPPLKQWWRLGGWWVGADPNAGRGDGRLHNSTYGAGTLLMRRSDADGNSARLSDGHQRLYYREAPCADGAQNGNETDVDCGGICGGCSLGAACEVGGDCASGRCLLGECGASAANCGELLQLSPGLTSGVYAIDPDGEGGDSAFEVYCDMETAGGGWTLAFATREFMAREGADPGVSWHEPANRSVTRFINPPEIMEGHAVPPTAEQVLWMCDLGGDPAEVRWWQTALPPELVDNVHTIGGQGLMLEGQSANAQMTPNRYLEGTADEHERRYFWLSETGAESCSDDNRAVWGSYCFSDPCYSTSGYCANRRSCDGVDSDGSSRFWLFWRNGPTD